MKSAQIPVIDLFAGPGGLGEGFSSLSSRGEESPFRIVLSIEKDKWAHKTLCLRSFYRQFAHKGLPIPEQYYQHVQNPSKFSFEKLRDVFPNEAAAAEIESWCFELGKQSTKDLNDRVKGALKGNKNWLLIGGPPCQAYSLAGRSRNAGNNNYVPENDERHFLYKQYLKIIAEHWPAVFVMENVKGILSSKVENMAIFPRIQEDLKNPGSAVNGKTEFKYELFSFSPDSEKSVGSFLIKSEEFGIPQARHRVIILGVRQDIAANVRLGQIARQKTVNAEDVLNLPMLRSAISSSGKIPNTEFEWKKILKTSIETNWFAQCSEEIQEKISSTLKTILACNLSPTSKEKACSSGPLAKWYVDNNLQCALNHEARGHRSDDLHRYLFASCFAAVKGKSPQLKDFPLELLPNHKSARKNGAEKAHFSDRFRVQIANKPSTTITCHISKDGHYYIHPDPVQCRSLTVREAARLQTFPDNYFFCGPRTEQFKQVGNAVPPLLAKQLAAVVLELFLKND